MVGASQELSVQNEDGMGECEWGQSDANTQQLQKKRAENNSYFIHVSFLGVFFFLDFLFFLIFYWCSIY